MRSGTRMKTSRQDGEEFESVWTVLGCNEELSSAEVRPSIPSCHQGDGAASRMMKEEEPESSSSTSTSANGDSDSERLVEPSRSTGTTVQKGRSCAGCLYHSSRRRESGRNPLCVGISRPDKHGTLAVYPIASDSSEWEASLRDGKRLLEFKYACLGYSVYKQGSAATNGGNQEAHVELPACLGLEFQMLDPRTAPQGPHQRVPTPQVEAREEDPQAPTPARPTPPRPPLSGSGIKSDEFATRFLRTAGLVAGAVAHNLARVAGSIKTGIDDLLYPDRRRPK